MPESTVSKTNSEFENITVETEKYENEQLTFTYEGKSYILPLSRDNFKEDIVYYPGSKLHSEQIINNKFGEKVTAVLTVDEGITKIKLCDVIGQTAAGHELMRPAAIFFSIQPPYFKNSRLFEIRPLAPHSLFQKHPLSTFTSAKFTLCLQNVIVILSSQLNKSWE